MTFPATRNKPINFIHIIIMLGLMIFVGKMPPPAPMTTMGMEVIGVFVGMAWGWIFMDLSVASLVGLVGLGLTSYTSVTNAFKSAFGNDTVLLLLFIFAIAGILEEAGLTRWIALRIMSVKITRGKPWVLTAFVMLATYVCALALAPTASMLVVWTIIYGIAEAAGYQKGDQWPIIAMVGAFMMATLGGVALPFKGMPAVIIGVYSSLIEGGAFDYFRFFAWMFGVDVAIGLAYLLVVKFLIKPDVTPLKDIKVTETEKTSAYQRYCLVWFILYIVTLFIPSLLPSSWKFVSLLSSVGNTGITAIFLCIWLACNFKECPQLGRVMNHIAWPVLFVVGSAMTVSASFMTADTGISEWITQAASPLLSNKGNLFFIIAVSLIVAIATQLCNNIATASLIGPICISIVTSLGLAVNLKAALMILVVASGMAAILPSGSAMSAVLHSNKEWVPGKAAYFYGTLIVVVTLLVCYIVGIPLASVLFPA